MSTRALTLAASLFTALAAGSARAELVVGPTLEVDYVGPDGTFLHYRPDAVWNDDGFVLAWADNAPGCETSCEYDIRAATVSSNGGASLPVEVFSRVGEDFDVALAARDARVCYAWKASGEGIYVGVGGATGPLEAQRLTTFGGLPAVAAGPDGWLLVWLDDLALKALHLTPAGTAVESTPMVLAALADVHSRPRVTHDDQSFVVVWADGPNEVGLLARRVPDSGTSLGPTVEVSVDDVSSPDIAWDGAQLGVTFVHGGVQLVFLDEALAARPDRSVSIRGGAGMSPTLAPRDGGGFLVVYAESRPASERWGDIGLYAMRVGPDGTLLDPGTPGVLGSGSALIVNDPGWLEWHPRLARGEGGQYLVVWEGSVDRTPTISTTGIFAVLLEDLSDPGTAEPETAEVAEGEDRPPRDEGCGGAATTSVAWVGLALLIRYTRTCVRRRVAGRR